MTEQEAARWMLAQYEEAGVLYKEAAASHLLQLNNRTLAYYDKWSNLRLGKGVVRKFNELTPDAVYDRSENCWRTRLETDAPGRQQ